MEAKLGWTGQLLFPSGGAVQSVQQQIGKLELRCPGCAVTSCNPPLLVSALLSCFSRFPSPALPHLPATASLFLLIPLGVHTQRGSEIKGSDAEKLLPQGEKGSAWA